jgi:hypothetical protein
VACGGARGAVLISFGSHRHPASSLHNRVSHPI